MNDLVENIRKYGNFLEDAQNYVEIIQEKIKMIDNGKDYYAKLEIEFKGMYMRSSRSFGVTEQEVKDILNNRLNEAITKRDDLVKKLNSFI